MDVARYLEVMAARKVQAFGRLRGDTTPYRWRVSTDEWDRLEAAARSEYGWTDETFLGESLLFGYPIAPDSGLPPNSVVLE